MPVPTLPAARAAGTALLCILLASPPALAHFQEVIPSSDTVTVDGPRAVTIDLTFTHPMERGPVMEMARPARFAVTAGEGTEDLLASLAPRKIDGRSAWRATYRFKVPGNYVFFVEPRPYWEAAEGKMIVHYTKVVVDAFAWGKGWDRAVGLPVEIVPLARPYGLWTGNVFSGVVMQGGAPVPNARIEVEWRNDGSVKAPSDAFITQIVKADSRGVFHYGLPRAGWWAFAALVEADKPMANPEGKPVPVELGGLIWVRARDMK